MKVWELIKALQKMPRDVCITWIIDGKRLDDNGVNVGLMLNPDGHTSVLLYVKVKQ